MKLASVVILIFLIVIPLPLAAASVTQDDNELPPVLIDALDGYRWSSGEVLVAPGQTLVVTNRDVDRHTFSIDEWGFDENLPTLEPVELLVPADADIGTALPFYSSVGEDRERGLEGLLIVVTPEEILSRGDTGLRSAGVIEGRQVIEVNDSFAFTPATVEAFPGEIIEVRNAGLIEHHFVVDEWELNETIPAGDVVLVQVPVDAVVGRAFTFYCSVPGHLAQGMSGALTIVPDNMTVETLPPERTGRASVGKDLRAFVPEAAFLGPDWEQLRIGAADTLLDGEDMLSESIFPQDGLGAIYVGPQGSRVTLIVLPVTEQSLPANQVAEAIRDVQSGMIRSWNKNRIATAAAMDDAPPPGCDTAQRASGIVPVLTIPGGATACQLRSPGVAIFVTVEGSVGDLSGVDAADIVIEMVVTQTDVTEPETPRDGR